MTTYYINSDTGNDTTGNGSAATPWLTFSKAHTSAASGDTIVAQAASAIYTFATVTFGKSLTLMAANVGDAIFDGTAGAAAWTMGAYSLTVENIIFQNVLTNQLGMFYLNGVASRDFLFKACIFRDIELGTNNGNTALITNLAQNSKVSINIDFIACAFENIHTTYTGIDTQIVTLANNSTNVGSDIDLRMINCTIYIPNTTYSLDNIVQLVYPQAGDDLRMYNTIIDNQSGNTVNFARYYGSSASTYDQADYCTFVNITSPPDAFTNGTGNSTTAPDYADEAGGDYRLQPSSGFTGGAI